MRVRTYGTSGPPVVVLHGGPGTPGGMAPVARGLADSFRVLEPFQRGSGGEPLTVARHVADLHELAESRCEDVQCSRLPTPRRTPATLPRSPSSAAAPSIRWRAIV